MVKKRYLILCLIVSMVVAVTSCSFKRNFAPVEVAKSVHLEKGSYQVRKGDTLYSVAWRYEMDYRHLATINHLSPPYELTVGQHLHLQGNAPNLTHRQRTNISTIHGTLPSHVLSNRVQKRQFARVDRWYWPCRGRLIQSFSLEGEQKGINIAAHEGTVVMASAPGEVAYAGNGIKGYGNLLIIKHNDEYLSAYAYNRQLFVREGDWVQAGQRIAIVGKSNKRAMLHFEIRKAGRPVNPLQYLR